MNRIDQLETLIDTWEYKKDLTDEQIHSDYRLLLGEIARLQRIIKNANEALKG